MTGITTSTAKTSQISKSFETWLERKPRFSTREWVVLCLVALQSLFLFGSHRITFGAIGSAALLSVVLLSWLFARKPIMPALKPLQRILSLFLILTGIGVLWGFVSENGAINIAKDFMKFGNVFLLLYFLRHPYKAGEAGWLVKWVVVIVYIPVFVGFLNKIGVNVPYFIAALDYGNQCIPIVLIIAAGLLFNPRMRKALAIIVFPPLYVIIVSMTRTYWAGLIAGLTVLYFLLFMDAQRRRVWPILFFACIISLCFYFIVIGRPFGSGNAGEHSIMWSIKARLEFLEEGNVFGIQSMIGRVEETERAIESIENWVVGNGLGEEMIINAMAWADAKWWLFVSTTWFHNAYIFFLLKMGLLGLGVYLGLLFILFRMGYQTFRKTTGFEKALSAFFIAYLTSASLMSLSCGNFISPRCWLLLGISGGVLANVKGRLSL